MTVIASDLVCLTEHGSDRLHQSGSPGDGEPAAVVGAPSVSFRWSFCGSIIGAESA